jgi:hydroxyacylglutathione hydrolase
MPGRLTLEDTTADQSSAARVIDFLRNRPVTHILGSHIGRDRAGRTYAEGAIYHPNERPLEMSREDLIKLPSAPASFNGFYASHQNYSITNPTHNLLVALCAAILLLSGFVFGAFRFWRWRRQA